MAGARRKGLNQDLQNWGIGRIRAVVGNSSVVQTVRPEIDQETDCKTIGVRQPKIGDRPNLMGCGPEWGCVSGYLRATTPDAGCTPRWHGRRKFMPSLQSQGDRADGPPRAVGKDTSRTSRGGQIFLLYYKCPLWPLTPPITIRNQTLGVICPVGAGAHAHRERPFPPASGPGNAPGALRLISARDGSCRYYPILANRPRSDFNAIVRITRPNLGTHPN